MLRWTLAALHLLALGIGLGSVMTRARAFRDPVGRAALQRIFIADTWWGIAAMLWIATGLWRLFASTEKPTDYYAHNVLFMAKMGGLFVILLCETWPMRTLLRWRREVAQGIEPDTSRAPLLARFSTIEAILVVLMVVAATGMARGYGVR